VDSTKKGPGRPKGSGVKAVKRRIFGASLPDWADGPIHAGAAAAGLSPAAFLGRLVIGALCQVGALTPDDTERQYDESGVWARSGAHWAARTAGQERGDYRPAKPKRKG
jgi:hypothetical protein